MEYKLSKNQKKIRVVREVKENIYDFTGIKVNSVYKGTVRSMYVQHQMERHCILPVKRKAMRASEILTEDYQGIFVHDHDRTFYHYGTDHQECLAHVLRYLKDSIENEPDRRWNKEMRSLIQEIIHFRNGYQSTEEMDPLKFSGFEERY